MLTPARRGRLRGGARARVPAAHRAARRRAARRAGPARRPPRAQHRLRRSRSATPARCSPSCSTASTTSSSVASPTRTSSRATCSVLHPQGVGRRDDRDVPSRAGAARPQLHDHLGRRSPHRARALLRGPAPGRAAGSRHHESSRSTTAARPGSTRTTSTRRSGSTRWRAGRRRSGAWSRRASTRCAAVVTTSRRASPTWMSTACSRRCASRRSSPASRARSSPRATIRELGLAALRAWNDWHIEEWAGPHPDRVIPLQLAWVNDPEIAAADIRRNAERGFKAVSFPGEPVRHRSAADDRPVLGSVPARVRGDRDRRVPAQRFVVVDRGPLAGHAARALHEPVPGERARHRGRLAVGAGAHPLPGHQDRVLRGRHQLGADADRPHRLRARPFGGRVARLGRHDASRRPTRCAATSGSARSTSARRSRCAITSASITSASRATTRTPIPRGPTRSRTRRPRCTTFPPTWSARSRGRTRRSSSAIPFPSRAATAVNTEIAIHQGALMYTDDAVSTGSDDPDRRRLLAALRRRPALPCTTRCTTRVPSGATDGHVRRARA